MLASLVSSDIDVSVISASCRFYRMPCICAVQICFAKSFLIHSCSLYKRLRLLSSTINYIQLCNTNNEVRKWIKCLIFRRNVMTRSLAIVMMLGMYQSYFSFYYKYFDICLECWSMCIYFHSIRVQPKTRQQICVLIDYDGSICR